MFSRSLKGSWALGKVAALLDTLTWVLERVPGSPNQNEDYW